MAAADPSPAAVMTWARGLAAFPAAQTPVTVVRPVGSATTQPFSCVSHPRPVSRSLFGDEAGADEDGVAGDDPAVLELDTLQPVVLDDEAGDRAVDDADGAGDELLAFVVGDAAGVGEEHDVGRPLTDQERVLDRVRRATEHAEALVADLVTVAVRAVEQVAAPALADAREVGELVAEPGGDQDPAGAQCLPVRDGDVEAAVVAGRDVW